MRKASLVYSHELASFDYGDNHPFKPIRAHNTIELCNRYGLLDGMPDEQVTPISADRATMELFHTSDYLDLLKRSSEGDYELAMLASGIGGDDCPPLRGVYPFSALSIGATMTGVDLLLDGKAKRAFNLVGGFHHGGRDHAEGFCYVNDVGVAIEYLLQKGKRVAFVDIDAHHGNGVQDGFYNDPRVLTISLHQVGENFYPQTGFENEIGEGDGVGYCINVPLLEKTDDQVYLNAFGAVVPRALKAFAPDIVIAEIGADTMISDPLTSLRLTTNGYYSVMKRLVQESPLLLAVGGGGYDIYRTSKCWTLAWAAMTEEEPEDDYSAMVGGMMYGAEMDSLFDRPLLTQGEDKRKAVAYVEKVVASLEESVFPILEAKRS